MTMSAKKTITNALGGPPVIHILLVIRCPGCARMLASITNKLRFSNGYAEVDRDGNFAMSGLAAGTYEITLNTYYTPPHQGVRLLPTLKQVVKVSDASESQVLFTIFPGSARQRAN